MTAVGFVHAWQFMEGFISAFMLMSIWKFIRWGWRRALNRPAEPT